MNQLKNNDQNFISCGVHTAGNSPWKNARTWKTEIVFFERELDLCHVFLDIAGPKQTVNPVADTRQRYQSVLDWIGTVNDPTRLVAGAKAANYEDVPLANSRGAASC